MNEYKITVKETCYLDIYVESEDSSSALKVAKKIAGSGIDAWCSTGFRFSRPKLMTKGESNV